MNYKKCLNAYELRKMLKMSLNSWIFSSIILYTNGCSKKKKGKNKAYITFSSDRKAK